MVPRSPTPSAHVSPFATDPKRGHLRPGNREGVAFILALITLTVLGLVVTGSFYAARQETRISVASELTGRAFSVSETGIADVLANWQGERFGLLSVGAADQVTAIAAEGSALVDVRRISERLYLLDSRASLYADPQTQHRIAVLTRLRSPMFSAGSAALVLGQLVLEGDAGVTGADFTPLSWASLCGASGGAQAGVIIPDATSIATSGGAQVSGSPPVVENPGLGAAALVDFGGISWAELVAVADVHLPSGAFGPVAPQTGASGTCQTASASNWGDPNNPDGPCGRYFPVVHVTGDLQLAAGSVGQGVLLVEGNLHLTDDTRFFGVIVAHGEITIEGAGVLLAGTVRTQNLTTRNPSTVREVWVAASRCAINRAILNNPALTRAEPIPARSWIDFTALEG